MLTLPALSCPVWCLEPMLLKSLIANLDQTLHLFQKGDGYLASCRG